jgi:hypothetical protein
MLRLFPILILALLTSCASQMPDRERQANLETQKATQKNEQTRLRDIYRKAFTRAFLEAWDGHGGSVDIAGLIGEATDPNGKEAFQAGYLDGRRAGLIAKLNFVRKQQENEKY